MLKRVLIPLLLAIVLGLMLSGPAYAESAFAERKSNAFQGSWSISLGAKRFEDDFNQKATSDFSMGADLRYQPLELIQFRVLPAFHSSTGYTQTEDESSGSSGKLLIREASANITSRMLGQSMIRLSLGALNQEALHSALLFSEDLSFPAARLSLSTDPQAVFVGGLHSEAAIVTASSLSTQTQNFEKTPTFQSHLLFLKLQKTVMEAQLLGGVFEFENLPMSVATKSGLFGNTTDSTTALDSVFRYAYKGSLASGNFKANFSRTFASGIKTAWVQNREAPQSQNQGSVVEAYADLDLSRNFQISPFYDYFRVESDATVASFNNEGLNTNRVGYSAGFRMSLQKMVKLTLSGGERDVLLLSPTQARERTWNLRLETFDVAI
jgi:hypothetical protein